MATSMDNDTWTYHPFTDHEHGVFSSQSSRPLDSDFFHELAYNDSLDPSSTTFLTNPQRITRCPQYDYSLQSVTSHYLPPSHLSMQSLPPFYGSIEPQMTINPEMYQRIAAPACHRPDYELSTPTRLPDLDSSLTPSPPLSLSSSPEQFYPHPIWPHPEVVPMLEQNVSNLREGFESEGEEVFFDKPYAQLIYEALLQAPGHRMLLRDIYEWFVQNTRKPQESGTNGWQNSIRHNLSMNHAFENDKNDPAASRGARKANSVWVLTDNAIRHGVQSTTRYRKNISSKKNTSGGGGGEGGPAIQRQRSGARGGRAARRAARMKRSARDGQKPPTSQPKYAASLPPFRLDSDLTPLWKNEWPSYSTYEADTPDTDQLLTPVFDAPPCSHSDLFGQSEVKHEINAFLDEEKTLRRILGQSRSQDGFGVVTRF